MSLNEKENLLLNDRWLRLAEFWAANREGFRKTALIIVISAEALLFAYTGWLLFDMFVLNAERDAIAEQQLTAFPDQTELHAFIKPQPLPAPVAVVLPESVSGSRYDVLLRFSNPNSNWYADISYEAAGQSGTVRILNGQERLVVVPGAATSLGGLPDINIVDTSWRRIKNVSDFANRTPNFVVGNVTYNAAADDPGRVTFNLVNDSIFNFWEASATVALLQGSRAIAARQVQLRELLSGEERAVIVNFFGGVGSVTDVLVVPFVDVADPSIFMDIEAPQPQF